MESLQHLSEVPPVIWSGVVAAAISLVGVALSSAIALLGVIISNTSNTKRLVRQLSHDSSEKARDRLNALHREVYLEAAEQMARANAYFGKLPQLDPAKVDISEGLAGFFAVSAKLQLIAAPETTRLVGELTTRYGEILMTLLRKAQPIHNANVDIRIAADLYERNQSDVNRVLAEMRQLNESGKPDPVRFDALQRSYEHAKQLADHWSEEQRQSWNLHNRLSREYIVEQLQQMRSIGHLQLEVTAAIRSELGLVTDMAQYVARMEANWERMDRQLGLLLESLDDG